MNPVKTAFAVTIAGLFLVSLTHMSIAGEWHIETINPEAVGINPDMPSLDLDSQGIPHISYSCLNSDYDLELRYVFWNGEDWQVSTVDNSYHPFVSNLKLDSMDRPHIGYSSGEYNIRYAYSYGQQWIYEWVNPVLYSSYQNSLALDSQATAHISFACDDWDTGYLSLVYAHKVGNEWVNETVDEQSEDVGRSNSIAIDSEDHPHISYFDNTNNKVKYAKWTGSEWNISIVDDTVNEFYYGTSLAIDQQDNPHISYCKNYNLCYAYWDGEGWNIQVVDDTQDTGCSSSLAIDGQGRPHISYAYYQSPNHYIKYAYFDGATWEIQTVTKQCDDDGVSLRNCLALNNADQPYIAYAEYINEQFTLKLAWQGDGFGLAVNLLSFTATPQEDSSVLLNWRVETSEGEQIAGFNLYRREINDNLAAEVGNLGCIWTQVNPSLITGQNPYAYTDGDVAKGTSYEYKLEAVLADETAETLGTCQATTEKPTTFAILSLYPNPASDVLNIALTLPQAGEVTLELYDLTGRAVASRSYPMEKTGEDVFQMDISDLAPGVYIAKVALGGANAQARVVVAR